MRHLLFATVPHTTAQHIGKEFPCDCEILVGRSEEASAPPRINEQDSDAAGRHSFRVTAGLRTLSQEHARLNIGRDGDLSVEDLGSTNGTFVRLPPGHRTSLSESGEVLFGRDFSLRLQSAPWSSIEPPSGITEPVDLLRFISRCVDSEVATLRLVDAAERAPIFGLRLPLRGGQQHLLVDWNSGTPHADLERWLRELLMLWNSRPPTTAESSWHFTGLSPGRRRVLELAQRIAPSSCSILLLGPTGCGKDVLARDIHDHSPRARRSFVAINCAAIPKELCEAELFGYVKGAFTGADANRVGLVEAADGGTLFLDEVADLPMDIQAKLLRFLNDSSVRPVGGHRERKVDVRVLAATCKDLGGMVRRGDFREDLYYRLNPVPLQIPAPGPADIAAIVRAQIPHIAERQSEPIAAEEIEALGMLASTGSWPGGVRQILNVLKRHFLLRDAGSTVAKNWHQAMALEVELKAPVPPLDRSASLSAVRTPLAATKIVDNLIFLKIVQDTLTEDPQHGITEIAVRVSLTYQGVVARLKALGLRFDKPQRLAQIAERIAVEKETLRPYLPLLLSAVTP